MYLKGFITADGDSDGMQRSVLSIDAGTTSVRAMLFSREGDVLAQSQRPIDQIYPDSGWVEHDAMQIWERVRDCVRDVLSSPDAGGCEAVGITNQRETVVVWDRHTGEPVCNAIVWQDRRTADICDRIRADGHCQGILERTGLQVDAYFSATKIEWILDNVPGARERAENGDLMFGTVETWLIWNLTGRKVHATDYTNASRTMMFNIRDMAWDPDIISCFNIPGSMLPEVCPNCHVFGNMDRSLFGTDIPIAGSAGDQQAALFGQACFDKGDVKITFGTGGFVLMNIGPELRISSHGLLTTVAWDVTGRPEYAIEGSVYIAGAAVQWLRDELNLVEESSETEAMAMSVGDTAGCYVVPAFVGLGAPYWDQNARGIIMGLTRGTNRCHIARAALESIAFQANDVIKAMEEDAGTRISTVKVDGGASANNFLCQFLADITGVEVQRPKCIESTALGAAYMAGLAVGFWSSEDELSGNWSLDRVFLPSMSEAEREEHIRGWDHAVRCAKTWSATDE